MVAGLICARRSIVSADTCRNACHWRSRSSSSGRNGAKRLEQIPASPTSTSAAVPPQLANTTVVDHGRAAGRSSGGGQPSSTSAWFRV